MTVSIITVCYNAESDLVKTFESVLNQTFRDVEYIVVDGASNDGTISAIKSYVTKFAEKGIPFRWISEPDKGTYDAMNKGACMANGIFVNYMNAGDVFYENDTLKSFFSKKIETSSGVLFGDTYNEYDFGGGIAKYEDYKKDNPVMPFCHQSCFVRTELMRKYKFDLSYRITADHDLFYRLNNDRVKYQYVECVVARYNGQYGLSATNPLMLRLEGLRIHHVKEKWYYPFVLIKTYLRYGWIAWFKRVMPKCITNVYMKYKRRYIR